MFKGLGIINIYIINTYVNMCVYKYINKGMYIYIYMYLCVYIYNVYMKSESDSCSVVSDSLLSHGLSVLGSSVHGILQARTLEWVAIPFSGGSSQTRHRTWVSHIAGRFFTI